MIRFQRRALLALLRLALMALAVHEALALAALGEAGPVLVAVTAERPVRPLIVALIMPLRAPVLATALRTLLVMRGRGRRLGRQEGLLEPIVARRILVVADLVEALAQVARPAAARPAAVHHVAGLIELLAVGHDDAAVVLGMLEVIFRQHGVAARLRLVADAGYVRRRHDGIADPKSARSKISAPNDAAGHYLATPLGRRVLDRGNVE